MIRSHLLQFGGNLLRKRPPNHAACNLRFRCKSHILRHMRRLQLDSAWRRSPYIAVLSVGHAVDLCQQPSASARYVPFVIKPPHRRYLGTIIVMQARRYKTYAIDGVAPVIDPTAFVHPDAVLIGDVVVGAGCYVGPCASLRGISAASFSRTAATSKTVAHCTAFQGLRLTARSHQSHHKDISPCRCLPPLPGRPVTGER